MPRELLEDFSKTSNLRALLKIGTDRKLEVLILHGYVSHPGLNLSVNY